MLPLLCGNRFLIFINSLKFVASVEHSGGQQVRLDLQKLAEFSLFPGQVNLWFREYNTCVQIC